MNDSLKRDRKNNAVTTPPHQWDLGAYEPCNHISQNRKLAEQFNHYWSHFRSKLLTSAALKSYFDSEMATQHLDLLWHETELTWPVAYNQGNGVVQIHPLIGKLDNLTQMAKAYILTEVFDQVIYAQLHAQLLIPELNTPLEENQKVIVPQLLRIKLAKQQAIQQNQFFFETEPQVILDPYCAWALAVPLHVGDAEMAHEEFNRAIVAWNQQQPGVLA